MVLKQCSSICQKLYGTSYWHCDVTSGFTLEITPPHQHDRASPMAVSPPPSSTQWCLPTLILDAQIQIPILLRSFLNDLEPVTLSQPNLLHKLVSMKQGRKNYVSHHEHFGERAVLKCTRWLDWRWYSNVNTMFLLAVLKNASHCWMI